jgi:hypothetical protein
VFFISYPHYLGFIVPHVSVQHEKLDPDLLKREKAVHLARDYCQPVPGQFISIHSSSAVPLSIVLMLKVKFWPCWSGGVNFPNRAGMTNLSAITSSAHYIKGRALQTHAHKDS